MFNVVHERGKKCTKSVMHVQTELGVKSINP